MTYGSDNIYLNVSVTGLNTQGVVNQATYNVSYDQNILEKPSDYYLAITGFQIPLQNIPLYVFPTYSPTTTNTYYLGLASQAATTVTGVGVSWSAAMIGGTITFANGVTETITAVPTSTTLTVSVSQTVASQRYTISFLNTGVNADPNLSSIIVGVCQQNNHGTAAIPNPPSFPVNVEWVPQVDSVGFNTNNPAYYYLFNYDHFTDLINQALLTSWTRAGSLGGAGAQPYIFFNPTSGLFSIVMPLAFVNATAAANFHWTVFFNFSGAYTVLPFYFIGNTGRFEIWEPPAEYDNSLVAPVPIGSNARVASTSGGVTYPPAYIFTQEYTSVDYLNSIRKIVITSATIPVQKQYFPNTGGMNNATTNSIGILSDFNLDLTTPGAQRTVALYSPSIYKLIDLISDSPMRTIDVAFWWVDRLNNFYPLTLTQFDNLTMQIGFFSKKLYRNQALKNL